MGLPELLVLFCLAFGLVSWFSTSGNQSGGTPSRPSAGSSHNPNLASCKACGGVVSKNAEVCPHCGERDPFYSDADAVRDAGEKAIAWFVLIIVMGVIGAILMSLVS